MVPEALLGILQEGWTAERVADEAGLELLAIISDDGGEVFRVAPNTQIDEGKFAARIQVDGDREEVVISSGESGEEGKLDIKDADWSYGYENGNWEEIPPNPQVIALQLGYTEDECGNDCMVNDAIPNVPRSSLKKYHFEKNCTLKTQ